MASKFLGWFLITLGTVTVLTGMTFLVLAIWAGGPDGGYPRGQFLGSGFVAIIFGLIIGGSGAAIADV